METHGTGAGHESLVLPLTLLRSAVVLAFAALAVGFWLLQIAQHDKYYQLAENNHQRTIGLSAPRGVVFDRDGRVLVQNRYSLNISLVREQVEDLEGTLALLAEVSGVASSELRSVVERHRRDPAYRPIVLIRDASPGQVAAVAAHALELPGLFVQQLPTRFYPAGKVAAHLFGYVGEVSDQQLATAEFQQVRSGSVVGKSGIERTYNQLLMGRDGARRVVVDSVGRENRHHRRGGVPRGSAAAADPRLRPARGGRGRVRGGRVQRGGGGARPAVRRDPVAGQPAGLRPQRVRDGNRRGHLERAQPGHAAAAEQPGAAEPLLARVDLQDRDGGRGARGGHRDARLPCVVRRGRPPSTGAATSAGRHMVPSTCGRRSSGRATRISTRSAR